MLAVPKGIDLSGVSDPWVDLTEGDRKIVNNIVQFNFGTAHQKRMEDWFQNSLPHHRVISQARTYEVALSLVQEGVGVAVVPALTAQIGGSEHAFDVDLYQVNIPDREIVGLVPSQYVRVEPFATFFAAVEQAGKEIQFPQIHSPPPFIKKLMTNDKK